MKTKHYKSHSSTANGTKRYQLSHLALSNETTSVLLTYMDRNSKKSGYDSTLAHTEGLRVDVRK